jgi:tRNA 2-thiouridine synthesizing protein A
MRICTRKAQTLSGSGSHLPDKGSGFSANTKLNEREQGNSNSHVPNPTTQGMLIMSEVLTKADCEVDARGLNCPMPILKAKKGMRDLQPGQVMHIIATDSGAANDFPLFCKQSGNELVDSSQENGEYHFYIRKS